MPSTLTVPEGFAYVPAALVSTVFLLGGQTAAVSKHRRLAKIAYPRLYADNAEMAASPAAVKFNCVQRAHQNTIENLALIYMMTVVLGLTRPKLAAAGLASWVVSRVFYTIGYASGIPAKRNSPLGSTFYFSSLCTLVFGSMYSAFELVSAGI
ncbi:hypothetical protein MKEN_00256700 [Mycena kentingensis (nom. inval.)]|nr:hypothetical protein MKEN_00256700 [Mycena kentingensis (nom. inval.)]